MKSTKVAALGLWLIAAGKAVAGPTAVRQVILDATARLAQNAAYQRVGHSTEIRMPPVGEIAAKLNGILTKPLPADPGIRADYLKHEEAMLLPLSQTISAEGATDEQVAQALEQRARSVNAEAEAFLPVLWATNRISAERLQGLAAKAQTLLQKGEPFLAPENEKTVKAVAKVGAEQASLILKQGIRRAERIARDFKDALRRAGLSEPELAAWSDEATDLKKWLVSDLDPGTEAVPMDDAMPDPAKLAQARLKRSSPRSKRARDREAPPLPTVASQDMLGAAQAVTRAFDSSLRKRGQLLDEIVLPYVTKAALKFKSELGGPPLLEVSLEPRPDHKLLVKSRFWDIQMILAREGFMAEPTEEPDTHLVHPMPVSPEEAKRWYLNLHVPELGKQVTREMIADVVKRALDVEKSQLEIRDSGDSNDGIAILYDFRKSGEVHPSWETILLVHSKVSPEGVDVLVDMDAVPNFQEILAARGLYAEIIGYQHYLVHPRVLTPEQARGYGAL